MDTPTQLKRLIERGERIRSWRSFRKDIFPFLIGFCLAGAALLGLWIIVRCGT